MTMRTGNASLPPRMIGSGIPSWRKETCQVRSMPTGKVSTSVGAQSRQSLTVLPGSGTLRSVWRTSALPLRPVEICGAHWLTTGLICRSSSGWRTRTRPISVRNATFPAAMTEIGGVLLAQGDLSGALSAYRESLDISERLAASDPGNSSVQHDLSNIYNKIGDVLKAQGNLPRALDAYRQGKAIAEASGPAARAKAQ